MASPKEKVQLGVIGVGVALLGITFVLNSLTARKKQAAWKAKLAQEVQATAPAVPSAPEPELPVTGPADEARIQQQIAVLKEPWGKDPFRDEGLAKTVAAPSVFKLKGVSIAQGKPAMAVINESIVQEGDRLDDHIVKRIEPTQVVLQRGEQELILKLEEEEEKKK
ncbi:MAG: hypothetical protein HYZ93_04995 [Candidatus Omnitrophica bacterium]|nr:hypothetical protein [Candidatus Omnitrophota bacterium]